MWLLGRARSRVARSRVARSRVPAGLLAAAIGLSPAPTLPPSFSPTPWLPAPTVPLPACPNELTPFATPTPAVKGSVTPSDTASTSAGPLPVALPMPASGIGGARLAEPGRQVSVPAGVPEPPAIRATAWLVADLDTGAVLASCNAHVPLAPASTLKVLTAVALIHVVPASAHYTARPQDAAVDGTRAGLVPGSVYSVDNLWHGLLMSSGNDCATALAELAGGPSAAAALMRLTAQRLGAGDTVVDNTSGLDAPGQVSSAYDLAEFGRAALRDPQITAVMRTRSYPFPEAGTTFAGGGGRKAFQIQNHNRLLFNYPGATGVKNGYTIAAGGSYVGSATRGGKSYLVTMLRADTNTWRAAAELLDWAFAAGASAQPVGTLDGGPAPAATAPPAGSTVGTPGSPTDPFPPTGPPVGTAHGAQVLAGQPADGPAAPATPDGGTPPRTRWLWLGAALLAAGTIATLVSLLIARARPGRRPPGRYAPRG